MKTKILKPWVGTKEAAELLGVCQRTVQAWVDDGKLKSTRTAGGHRRISLTEIKDFQQPASNVARVHATEDGPLKVLIVEDDPLILRLIEFKFSKFTVPHELYIAKDAFHGLILIGKHAPHVIFTDLLMPEINGLQLIRAIIELPEMQDTKIVAITGLEAKDIIKLGKLPTGIMILHKPIPFDTVETILYQQAMALNIGTESLALEASV